MIKEIADILELDVGAISPADYSNSSEDKGVYYVKDEVKINSDIFENGPGSGSTSIEVSSSTSMTTTGVSLFVKPSLTGYIPISNGDWYITLSAGYNICPKFKDLNGLTFGAGFQVEL